MAIEKNTIDGAALIQRASTETIALAIFSGLIAYADNAVTQKAISALKGRAVSPEKLHEIILQSYLFCGFPRMLEALFSIAEVFPQREYLATSNVDCANLAYSEAESQKFSRDGAELIRKVYGDSYLSLESAITAMSPEVFRLIVIEGYGKTLSRPGLDSICRELATVAALTVDNRIRQLKAHLRGSLNVGATAEQITETLTLVRGFANSDYCDTAETMLSALLKTNCASEVNK